MKWVYETRGFGLQVPEGKLTDLSLFGESDCRLGLPSDPSSRRIFRTAESKTVPPFALAAVWFALLMLSVIRPVIGSGPIPADPSSASSAFRLLETDLEGLVGAGGLADSVLILGSSNGAQLYQVESAGGFSRIGEWDLGSFVAAVDRLEDISLIVAGCFDGTVYVMPPPHQSMLPVCSLSFGQPIKDIGGSSQGFFVLTTSDLYTCSLTAGGEAELLGQVFINSGYAHRRRSFERFGDSLLVAAEVLYMVDVSDLSGPYISRVLFEDISALNVCIRGTVAAIEREVSVSHAGVAYVNLLMESPDLYFTDYSLGYKSGMTMSDSYLVAGAGRTGVYIHDVSDLNNPELISCYTGPNTTSEILCLDSTFFILNVHDVTRMLLESYHCIFIDPGHGDYVDYDFAEAGDVIELQIDATGEGSEIGRIEHPLYPAGLEVNDGQLLYWEYETREFGRHPVQDFGQLRHLPTSFVPDTILGNLEYVCDVSGAVYCLVGSGVVVLDVSDTATQVTRFIPTSTGSYNLAQKGNIVFVAAGDMGIMTLDVSNPFNPFVTHVEPVADFAVSVAVYEDWLVAADRYAGVSVLDITDPSHPTLESTYQSSCCQNWYTQVTMAGDNIVAGGSYVETLGTDSLPMLYNKGSFFIGDVRDVASFEGTLYVAARQRGIVALDITDPFDVAQIGEDETPGLALGLRMHLGMLYVADIGSLLQFSPPVASAVSEGSLGQEVARASVELSVFPNPFNSVAKISLSLAKAGSVEIEILNVLGRRVRLVAERHLAAGDHEFTWDGRNEAGSMCVSGVYFCRVSGKDWSDSVKMLMLK